MSSLGSRSVLLALLLGAAPAHADEPPAGAEAEAGPHRLSLQLGLGAPLGAVGVGWAYAPNRTFRVESGVGAGFTGLQLSVMPMLSFGTPGDRFVAGAGVAWVPVRNQCERPCVWLNADLAGYERVFRNGYTLFLGAGIAVPLQRTGGGWFSSEAYDVVPQARIGFGAWLGGPARAEPTAPPAAGDGRPAPPVRRHRIAAHGGGGEFAPLGHGGLAYAYSFRRWLRVETGAGYGLSGYRLAVGPAVSFGSARHRFVAGAALGWMNRGYYACEDGCAALGLDLAGYELLFAQGFSVFLGGGISLPLEWTDRPGAPGEPVSRELDVRGHFRAGLAWWL